MLVTSIYMRIQLVVLLYPFSFVFYMLIYIIYFASLLVPLM